MSDRPGTGNALRPGTGNDSRPGTRNTLQPMSRLGTGSRVSTGKSGARLGTGRLGTGQQVPATPGQMAGYGVSLGTDINVIDRPVTQQGMMGMRAGTAGPRRQVQDTSYYMGVFHSKVAEIVNEIDKMNKEMEQDAKDKSMYVQLERKYEQLSSEVRDLEGKLADCNLAMDKLRSSTDPQEVRQIQEHLHHRNTKEAEEADQIFVLRLEKEKSLQRMEEEIKSIHLQHQHKINQLDPKRLAKYKELVVERDQMETQIDERSQELELLISMVQKKELQMNTDRVRAEYDQMEKKVSSLQKEYHSLQDELKALSMDPNEARSMLLCKVKEDKAKLEDLERDISTVEQHNQEINKVLEEYMADYQERMSGHDSADPSQKYEILVQRDREMGTFIDDFPRKLEEDLKQQAETKTMIVKLLEHISNNINKQQKLLPTADAENFEELKSGYSFKEKQLESSILTKRRLDAELQKRQQELDKVNSLDSKIAKELEFLKAKLEIMTKDMIEFQNVAEVKETHQQTKQYLQQTKLQYVRRRDAMKPQVQEIAMQLDALREEIANNETAATLEALEQKMRHHEQNIFHLREYINVKSNQVNYEYLKQDCLQLLVSINTLHTKRMGSWA